MIKKVCISSRIIFKESWDDLRDIFNDVGVESFFPKEEDFTNKSDKDSFSLMQKVMARYYPLIDSADLLYVYAPNGDVSKAVTSEIGYAKARGIKVITSEPVVELEIRVLVDEVVPIDNLKKYLEENNV